MLLTNSSVSSVCGTLQFLRIAVGCSSMVRRRRRRSLVASLNRRCSCYRLAPFFGAVCVGPVKKLSLSRVIQECDGQSVMMCVPKATISECFDYGYLRLIDRMEVQSTLECVAVARLCEVEWDALRSYDWFQYDFKTGKSSRVGDLVPVIRKLADGTEAKNNGTDGMRPIYR